MKQFWKRSLAAVAAALVLGTSGMAVSAQTPVTLESSVISAAWNNSARISPEGEYTQVKQAIYEGLLAHQDTIDVSGLGLPADQEVIQDVYVSVLKTTRNCFGPWRQPVTRIIRRTTW